MAHHDYKKKEPNKTERVLYELYMQQQMLERNLMTTTANVVALGILLKIEPEKIAEMLTNGNEQIKEYSEKINKALDKIQQERQAANKPNEAAPAPEQAHEEPKA